jgi:hypothetical protein
MQLSKKLTLELNYLVTNKGLATYLQGVIVCKVGLQDGDVESSPQLFSHSFVGCWLISGNANDGIVCVAGNLV